MLAEAKNFRKNWQKKQCVARLTDKKAYVYVHLKKDTQEPFYVGIGWTSTRPWNFKERSDWHKNTVKKHGVIVEIVVDNLTLSAAKFWEATWVKALSDSGYRLANQTPGGDANPMEIDSVRKKHFDSVPRGENHPSKREEARENLRRLNTGKKYSEETNAKKGRKGPKLTLTEEGRQILKQPKKATTRAKMSATALIVQSDPVQRAKNSAGCIAAAARRTKEEKSAIGTKVWESRLRNQGLEGVSEQFKRGWETRRKRDQYWGA